MNWDTTYEGYINSRTITDAVHHRLGELFPEIGHIYREQVEEPARPSLRIDIQGAERKQPTVGRDFAVDYTFHVHFLPSFATASKRRRRRSCKPINLDDVVFRLNTELNHLRPVYLDMIPFRSLPVVKKQFKRENGDLIFIFTVSLGVHKTAPGQTKMQNIILKPTSN